MQVGPLDEYGPEVRRLVGKQRSHADKCYQAAQSFYEQHEIRSRKALEYPIGVDFARFSFRLGESIRPFYKPGSNEPKSDAGYRPRLLLQEQTVYQLKVIKSLGSGNERWSQVYQCSLEGDGVPEGTILALKLYQESLFPIPPEEHFFPWLKYDFARHYQPADYFARRESFAYENLAEEQGRLVPWCFGFYKFKLPCGEEVEGVVLEHIEAQKFPDYIRANLLTFPATVADEPLVHASFDIIFKAYIRLLDFGVAHGDGGYGNILVVPGSSPKQFQVILMDFGLAMGEQFCASDRVLQDYAFQGYSTLRKSLKGVVPDEICDSVVKTPIYLEADAIFDPLYGKREAVVPVGK